MNSKPIVAITLISLFTLHHTTCSADALDDLLKQLEEAELKPAEKKAPPIAKPPTKQPIAKEAQAKQPASKAPDSKTPVSKKQHSAKQATATPPSRATGRPSVTPPTSADFLEKTPSTPRKDNALGKREQRITSFFQTKISPIAEGIFKLVDSKETQQLVETAKKKRLEREKSVAAKTGKGSGAKPRYSQVGSGGQGGYGGWKGAGKGYDAGFGGYGGYGGAGSYGKSSWSSGGSASPSSHGFETPTQKPESLKASNSTGAPDKREDTNYRSTSGEKDEFGTEKQQVLNMSDGIQRTLSSWLAKLDDAPTAAAKNKVFTEISKQFANLKAKVDNRSNALSDSGKLPPEVGKSLRAQIKNKEEGMWNRLRKHDENFEAHETAQNIKENTTKQQALLDRESILQGHAVSQPLSPEETKEIQLIRDQLTKISPKITAGPLLSFKLRVAARLTNPGGAATAALFVGTPAAQPFADVTVALDAIKADFFTIDLKAAIDDFFAPAP